MHMATPLSSMHVIVATWILFVICLISMAGYRWMDSILDCANGLEGVVEMLAEDDRIDVNRASKTEQTPLWRASYHGKLGVVKRLLASTREIDVLRKDYQWKKTPAEFARKQRNFIPSIEVPFQEPSFFPSFSPHGWELFALVVFLSDGYLAFHPERQGQKEQRFLSIAARLPMDLQMVLCNRVFGVPDSIVKKTDSERGFRKFAKGF